MRLRLATFNLESLDERTEHGTTLDARIAVLRPLLTSLNADILCLQEVNGQSTPTGRTLAALKRLLEGTPYAAFAEAHSGDNSGKPRDVHNLVTLSRFPIRAQRQVRHEFITAPLVRICTTVPAPPNASEVTWDRPLLHVTLDVGGQAFEVINLHLRAPLSVMIPGQKENANRWTSVPGWAEGFYISSIKRNGQALEARVVVDGIFDADASARVAVCGDLNSGEHEVPIATLRGHVDDTGNPTLGGRVLTGVEDSLAAPQRFTVRHAGRPLMLDHILVSQTLWGVFRKAEALNAGLADEVADAARGIPGSFHAPLVAEFEL